MIYEHGGVANLAVLDMLRDFKYHVSSPGEDYRQ